MGGNAYTYAAAPYAIEYEDVLYEYATGEDGKGYYTTFDGQEWSTWSGWDDQTTDYQWQPAAAEYKGKQYVFYDGTDNTYYANGHDGQTWDGWQAVAGEYEFPYAPYANT